MMFADDQLMFSRADYPSIEITFDTSNKFPATSGLVANLSKSDVYLDGIHPSEEDIIISSLGISRGSFPFKGPPGSGEMGCNN